jgi:hypothetical protein
MTSMKLMPAHATSTAICPGPGSGTGTSATRVAPASGAGRSKTTARMTPDPSVLSRAPSLTVSPVNQAPRPFEQTIDWTD